MEKVKMGVIGVRGFGKNHMKGIIENDFAELIEISDILPDIAKERSEEFNVPYTTDYRELISNPEIDAVCVVVPDQIHSEVACAAMRQGKHVLCEKPMALKLEECKEMIRVSEETGKKLMVGQICRFTPSFKKAKEMIDAGEIGELFFVESEYAHDYSHMKDCTWRFDPKAPRHGLIGGGCHAVDLLRWIAGDPIEVFGYGNHKMLKTWPTDDCNIAVMKFPDDVIGKVFCSTGCKREYTMRTCLYGSKGTIIVDNKSPKMSVYKSEVEGNEDLLGNKAYVTEIKIPVAVNNHNVADEIKVFVDALINNRDIDVNGKAGAATVAVCTAILESCETSKPVKVDYNF